MDRDALMAAGQQALQAGDVAGALHAYEQAATLAPDDLTLAWIRGVLLIRLERYQDALPHLVRAQGLPEQAASVWTHLGIAHMHLGNPEEGLAAYQRAVHVAPDDPNVRVRLATALNDTGRPAEALGVLERAVPLATDPVVGGFVALQRGVALNALGRHDEAAQVLDLVGDLGADPAARAALAYQQAVARNGLGRHADALAVLEAAPEAARAGPSALQRAVALNGLERWDEARSAATEARLDPSTARGAAVEEGIALAGSGHDAEALAVLADLTHAPASGRWRAVDAKAGALRRTGDATEAVRVLTGEVGEAPAGLPRRRLLLQLAEALAGLGRHDDALVAFDRAAEGRSDAPIELARADLLQRAGRSGAAAEALERAVAHQGSLADDPAVQHRRLVLGLAGAPPPQAATLLGAAADAEADPERARLLRVAQAEALLRAGAALEATSVLDAVAADGSPDGGASVLALLALGRPVDPAPVGTSPPADAIQAAAASLTALAQGATEVARHVVPEVGPLPDVVGGLAALADGRPGSAVEPLDRAAGPADALASLAVALTAWAALAAGDPAAGPRFVGWADGASPVVGVLGRSGAVLAGPSASDPVDLLDGPRPPLPTGHPAAALVPTATGVLLAARDRDDEAAFAYEQAADALGESTLAAVPRLGLGAAWLRLEDAEPALRAFQRAHDLAGADRPQVRALSGQGEALLLLGDGEKAVEAHRSAVRIAPRDAQAWAALARAYRGLQRPHAAEGAQARATELGAPVPVSVSVPVPVPAPIARQPEPSAPTAPAATTGGTWVDFWFSSGRLRRGLGVALAAAAVVLAVACLVAGIDASGLDADPIAFGAPLLAVVAVLVTPRPRDDRVVPAAALPADAAPIAGPEPTAVPPLVPADLLPLVVAAGVAQAALGAAGALVVADVAPSR